MNVSAASVRALERHFVGALTLPSRSWLDPEPLAHVVIASDRAIECGGDACILDFGAVESPGTERQVVRISGGAAAEMRVSASEPWLAARWAHTAGDVARGDAAELEVAASHDVLKETGLEGTVRILIGNRAEELRVRLSARRTHPLGAFSFHGSNEPRGFDFGVVDPLAPPPQPYELSFDSLTSVPLTVRFLDLPPWLTLEVSGHDRPGPAPGRFFERAAPFTAKIRPHCTTALLGRHDGVLRVESDDPRPAFRSFAIRFAVRLEPAGPCLRAVSRTVRATTARPVQAELRVENWGRAATRIHAERVPGALQISGAAAVPAAKGGQPGVAVVTMRLFPARLAPGAHALPVIFSVDGGPPLQVALPVQVAVPASRPSRVAAVAPAALTALLALLAFSVLFVLYLRTLS